jgi:hypothetical protein
MQKCPTCAHMNRPGVVFCENCGTNLVAGVRPASTKSLDEEKQTQLEATLGRSVFDSSEQGTAAFPENGILRMDIDGSPDPIILHFEHHEVILGRRDPATGALPDVDLTPYAGYRMGVSRRHSLIRLTDKSKLEILDLGSANGTTLNGTRLEPHHPTLLHEGDRITLGQITLALSFQKPSTEPVVVISKPTEVSTDEEVNPPQTALLGTAAAVVPPPVKKPEISEAGSKTVVSPSPVNPPTSAPASPANPASPSTPQEAASPTPAKIDPVVDTQKADGSSAAAPTAAPPAPNEPPPPPKPSEG